MTNLSGSVNSVTTSTASRSFKRILVFLDGNPASERAIPEAANLARPNNADVVILCRQHPGAEAYLNEKLGEIQREHVNAQGYIISDQAAKAPAWLVKTEKADAVVIAQEPVNWLGRLFGADVVGMLRVRTDAAIFKV